MGGCVGGVCGRGMWAWCGVMYVVMYVVGGWGWCMVHVFVAHNRIHTHCLIWE